MATATLQDIYLYFSDNKTNGYTMTRFGADWKALDIESKNQIRDGIHNGTLTY